MSEIIKNTREYAKEIFKDDDSGHDMTHTENVVKNALEICDIEGRGNREIVELAALLHDVEDWKLVEERQQTGGETAMGWLKRIGCDDDVVKRVKEIVDGVSYYGPQSIDNELGFEGNAVRDADRLEAMGESAVKRTRKFGVSRGIPEFNEFMPNLNLSNAEYCDYMRKENSLVNHFFEKLLFLKNKLKTEGGKQLGEEKHQYMKKFLREYLGDLKIKYPDRHEQIDNLLEMLDSGRYD